MNNAKSYFITYLGFGVGLISLSFLAIGWDKTSLITLGVAFVLTAVLFFKFSEVQATMARNSYGAHRQDARKPFRHLPHYVRLGDNVDTK